MQTYKINLCEAKIYFKSGFSAKEKFIIDKKEKNFTDFTTFISLRSLLFCTSCEKT